MREATTTEAATTGAATTDAAGLPAAGDERSSAAAETPRRRPAIRWSALGRFARVVADIAVGLPRPRGEQLETDAAFVGYVDRVRAVLRGGA